MASPTDFEATFELAGQSVTLLQSQQKRKRPDWARSENCRNR